MAGQISKYGRAKCPFVLAGKIEIETTTLCRNIFWFVHLPFFKIDVEVDAFYFFEADLKLLKVFFYSLFTRVTPKVDECYISKEKMAKTTINVYRNSNQLSTQVGVCCNSKTISKGR